MFFFLDLNSWDMLSLKFFFLETIGGSKLPFFFWEGVFFLFRVYRSSIMGRGGVRGLGGVFTLSKKLFFLFSLLWVKWRM